MLAGVEDSSRFIESGLIQNLLLGAMSTVVEWRNTNLMIGYFMPFAHVVIKYVVQQTIS